MQLYCNKGIYPLCFHLQASASSYVIAVSQTGHLLHLYYGAPLAQKDVLALLSAQNAGWYPPKSGEPLLDKLPLEYPVGGMADLRLPALQLVWDDGDTTADLRYRTHTIAQGKPQIVGLPSVYAESDDEGETLSIELFDPHKGLSCTLHYSVLFGYNAIMRSVALKNEGTHIATLTRAMSASLDVVPTCGNHGQNQELLHLHGAWIREFGEERLPLGHCTHSISSFKGASGHQHNPFAALVSRDCGEEAGEAYGFSLVYSGNFKMEAETNEAEALRLCLGLNDKAFAWPLAPNETFQTPEAVLVYSNTGLGQMSRCYHTLYQNRLCRGAWRNRPRPVLLNTWEGAYFDFNHDTLLHMAKEAAPLGVELFVLDDGWFGQRNDATTSLGDWQPNREKLGCTLAQLAQDINAEGLMFGLWVEPEMVSPDSDLYRAHPDWALGIEDREQTLMRTQLVLDLSRKEVQEYIISEMTALFESANIAYVKWDMNRNFSEVASPNLHSAGATAHQYMLGLYRVLETLTARFPQILFESCASGGGRFDAGMLHYMPQGWLSDNSDAVCRWDIQYGAATVYPPCCMGAHISAVPNHQVWRTTPMQTRFHTALFGGGFGYELDIAKLSEAEKQEVSQQIAQYKALREVRMSAKLYRLGNPAKANDTGWLFVGDGWAELTITRKIGRSQSKDNVLFRLVGLNLAAEYEIVAEDGDIIADAATGAVLMQYGINITLPLGDFASVRLLLKQK